MTAPTPLQARLGPGEQAEGQVACRIGADDTNVVCIFDNRLLTGNWTDRAISMEPGATFGGPSAPAVPVNDEGMSPDAPAGLGVQVATEGWVVTLEEAIFGQSVYDLYGPEDYRTTALGSAAPELVPYGSVLRMTVVNNRTGVQSGFLPATAFALAWEDGESVDDVRLLSPPLPELSGGYLAGATGIGWVTIELPSSYDGSLIRFADSAVSDDVRFLTWADGNAPTRGRFRSNSRTG